MISVQRSPYFTTYYFFQQFLELFVECDKFSIFSRNKFTVIITLYLERLDYLRSDQANSCKGKIVDFLALLYLMKKLEPLIPIRIFYFCFSSYTFSSFIRFASFQMKSAKRKKQPEAKNANPLPK